jgi:hypothetical protein
MAAVFLDIGKAIDTIWHQDFLYKLFKLDFLTNQPNLLAQFFRNETTVFQQKAICLHQEICKLGCHKVPLSLTLYNLYINYACQTIGINTALFADDTCL